VDTSRDPLQPQSVTPKLLAWQQQFLQASWAQQDAAAAAPSIDPDLISEADLQPGSAASFIWKDRSSWVNGQIEALKKLRESMGNNFLKGFDTVVGRILGPVADLLALDTQRVEGTDIEPQLTQKQLPLRPFVHLISLRKLAAAGTILASEWDDVYSILVQVEKLGSFAFWRSEEQEHKVVLGPDSFRLPNAGEAFMPPAVPPEWRMTAQARQTWQDTLKARINQQEALKQALLSVVDAAEEDTLPLLRDALVTAIGTLQTPSSSAKESAEDRLTRMLLIDIKSSGYQKITRIHQAIQTLQGVLIALRTKRLTENGFNWALDEAKELPEDFDEELEWMGSYGTWQAAM
jgi:hypothetical protein